ncbi:hypothetical protein OUZ56_030790 [Daphnia magna]|uniref:Uncharacterized protein n=1 Tax=Daphnia magna TaxID=35525 RepID=A0ABQ9ZSB1_9CRUS|nr:hypothetical protein OUZ56_030790 [Daphnia magna]
MFHHRRKNRVSSCSRNLQSRQRIFLMNGYIKLKIGWRAVLAACCEAIVLDGLSGFHLSGNNSSSTKKHLDYTFVKANRSRAEKLASV